MAEQVVCTVVVVVVDQLLVEKKNCALAATARMAESANDLMNLCPRFLIL